MRKRYTPEGILLVEVVGVPTGIPGELRPHPDLPIESGLPTTWVEAVPVPGIPGQFRIMPTQAEKFEASCFTIGEDLK